MTKPFDKDLYADLAARVFERIVSVDTLNDKLAGCDDARPAGKTGPVEIDGETLRRHQREQIATQFATAARQACDLAAALLNEVEKRWPSLSLTAPESPSALVSRLQKDPAAGADVFAGRLAEKMLTFNKDQWAASSPEMVFASIARFLEAHDFSAAGYFSAHEQPSAQVMEAGVYALRRAVSDARSR